MKRMTSYLECGGCNHNHSMDHYSAGRGTKCIAFMHLLNERA